MEKAIRNRLSTDANIIALVGTRIFPNTAPQEAEFPHIIYDRTNTLPDDTKDGISKLDVIKLDIDCYAIGAEEVQDIAEAVKTSLDRLSGTFASELIDSIRYEDQRSFFEETDAKKVFRITLEFSVRQKFT